MGEMVKYQRQFLIFEEEDQGYGTSATPSGYAKIEIKNGKGRLNVFVQNLKPMGNESPYRVYFIKKSGNHAKHVLIGDIVFSRSNGQMILDFDPDNIKNSGLSLNDFDVISIGTITDNNRIIWPLCAYRNEKIKWNKHVTSLIQTDNKQSDKILPKSDNSVNVISKYNADITSVYNAGDKKESNVIPYPTEDAKVESEGEEYQELVYKDKESVEPPQKSINTQNQYTDKAADCPVEPLGVHKCAQSLNQQHCANCYLHDLQKAKKTQEIRKGDMNQLRNELDTYFERYCPFNNRRKDYIWWKVNSPVYLNNILHQFDIKAAILFNPKVLMTHFKYRHLIVGIYKDKRTEKDYMVYGVPGAYKIDEKPFGDICRWVQVEGAQLRYGAFGYWLVYIDPISGMTLGT